jgi:hypothetical protein
MAAPEYVPRPKDERPRVYSSPPWRPEPWLSDRPGDLAGPQPVGPRLGTQGPDQGYALVLARQFEGKLVLEEGEDQADAVAGCVALALKRASSFGRAPTVHDLRVAFGIWGFLRRADADLVAWRREVFDEVAAPHHYMDLRALVDLVPVEVLRQTPNEIERQAADWRSFFAPRS